MVNYYKQIPLWAIQCLLLSILSRFCLETITNHVDTTSSYVNFTFNTFKNISETSLIVSGTFIWGCFITGAVALDIIQRGLLHLATSIISTVGIIFSESNVNIIWRGVLIAGYANILLIGFMTSAKIIKYMCIDLLNSINITSNIPIKLKPNTEYEYNINNDDKIWTKPDEILNINPALEDDDEDEETQIDTTMPIEHHTGLDSVELSKIHSEQSPDITQQTKNETKKNTQIILEKFIKNHMASEDNLISSMTVEQSSSEDIEFDLNNIEEIPIETKIIVEKLNIENNDTEETNNESNDDIENKDNIESGDNIETDNENKDNMESDDNSETENEDEQNDSKDPDYEPTPEEIEEANTIMSPNSMLIPFKGNMYYMDDEQGKVFSAIKVSEEPEKYIAGKEVGTCNMGAITLYNKTPNFAPLFG